jgi:hypothetical protein
MQTVVLKNGKEAKLLIDSRSQTATVITQDGESHLVMYMRGNKPKVKNDLLLNDVDLAHVRAEMNKFVKKVEPTNKKRK